MNFYEQLFCRGRTTGEGMTHFERLFAAKFGGSPPPKVREYTGAVPVTITADGTPLIDYLISGNTTQSGTPTPDNPIMPQGTGDTTANLAYGRIDGANIGSNGTIFRADWYDIAIGRVESGIIYTINGFVLAFYTNEPTIDSVSYDGSRIVTTPGEPSTFTAPITGYVAFRLNPGEPAMLNTGSTALPYEPWGIKIPISSANTTTPVYLGEVETTRKIEKLVLTGKETFGYANSCFTYTFDDKPTSVQPIKEVIFSNIYEGVEPRYRDQLGNYQCCITRNYNQIAIRDNNYADAADFKAYLAQQYAAGTPVTVWYVLATETTGIVNEPLMRIGDYADTLSKAQAGVAIPTNNGSTTVDVDTTVKPSEVYIKYMG